jgi:hypothetical protein
MAGEITPAPSSAILDLSGLPEPVVKSIKQLVESLREGIASQGHKVCDPQGEEHMRGPHAVLFGDSRNVVLRDVRTHDAANYAFLLERTSHLEVRGVECTGGWDGVHFRGRIDDWLKY